MEEIVKQESQESKNVQLIITMTPDGAVNVSGAINNSILAYGLLDVAKDCIRNYIEKLNQAQNNNIIKPNGNHRMMDFLRQKK